MVFGVNNHVTAAYTSGTEAIIAVVIVVVTTPIIRTTFMESALAMHGLGSGDPVKPLIIL